MRKLVGMLVDLPLIIYCALYLRHSYAQLGAEEWRLLWDGFTGLEKDFELKYV